MTVGELKEELNNYPDEYGVRVESKPGGGEATGVDYEHDWTKVPYLFVVITDFK